MNSEISQFEQAWERVRNLTGWADYKELAAFVGSSSQSISGIKKRAKFPLEWARKIAQEFGSFTDWLMDGVGPERRDAASRKGTAVREDALSWFGEEKRSPADIEMRRAPGIAMVRHKDLKPENLTAEHYVLVPRYEVAASAGGGGIVHSEQIVDYLSFKAEWIRNGLGLSEKDLALINVKGDSMEPTLSNDDLILIDMRTPHLQDNAVYVLLLNDVLLVKRLQRKLDGTVIVRSDNTFYEPEVISADMARGLNVIGRVVWCGRRM